MTTDGDVFALAQIGTTLYLGGRFQHVGMATGSGAVTAASDGTARPGSALLAGGDGDTTAVVADGAGGWYAGGSFTRAGGEAHAGVVHLRHDGTVVPAFSAQVSGTVSSLALDGSKLYVGGDFTAVDGVTHRSLAAVDATTGAIVSGWSADVSGRVAALAVNGSELVVGGDYSAIDGVSQPWLSAVATATGAVTSWRPRLDDRVSAVLASAGRIVAGGNFSSARATAARTSPPTTPAPIRSWRGRPRARSARSTRSPNAETRCWSAGCSPTSLTAVAPPPGGPG